MENLTADGRMKDLSGHGNNGTMSGTTDVGWGISRARAFDSNHPDSIAVSPGPTASFAFTFAFWLFPEGGGVGGGFSRIESMSNDRFEIGIDSGSGSISFFDGSWKTTATTASLNGWTHIALTWDGTLVRTYKNGVLSSVVTGGRSQYGNQFFGARWSGFEGYQGVIDEIRVFESRNSDSEIAGLASGVPTSDTSGPMLYYDMENLTADGRMKDLSGHGNNGTLSGTTDASGEVGRARDFNSSHPDSIRASAGPGAFARFSYAFWLFPESGGVGGPFSRILSRDSDQFEIATNAETGEISFFDGTWKSTGTVLSFQAW